MILIHNNTVINNGELSYSFGVLDDGTVKVGGGIDSDNLWIVIYYSRYQQKIAV